MTITRPNVSAELVLAHLDRLPPLPSIALQLIDLTARSDAPASQIITLLRGDQSLAARVIGVANSAANSVRQPVTTLERAVPLIGLLALRNIVLASVIMNCFPEVEAAQSDARGFRRMEFWKHALAVACASKSLAAAAPTLHVDPEEAYIAGLLHDLGKVALHAIFPKSYGRIAAQARKSHGDIADLERTTFGADHTIVGRRLAERWRLPKSLQELIWLHHVTGDALPAGMATAPTISIVQLADTIAREQRLGQSGNFLLHESSNRLAERIGVPEPALDTIVEHLLADVATQCSVLGLERPVPEAMYGQAMSRASADLYRVNGELIETNRRLAASARYFRAISEFDRNLTEWSDPLVVVEGVARAARTALECEHVAAFGVLGGGEAGHIAWLSGSGGPLGATRAVSADFATALLGFAQRADTVLPAPTPIRDIVAAVAPAGAVAGEWWLAPIAHDGQIVAGIVFVSERDEHTRLAAEFDDLRSFLISVGLAWGRAIAYAAARRLSEDLADTNRRLQQMQVESLRSRTLSMIAEMAAGAGHELNSPLTVISGRAQMLAAQVTDPSAVRSLEVITRKAHECSGIVSELMDFARPHPPVLEPVDLATLIAEVRDAAIEKGRLSPSRIAIANEPDADTRTVPFALADREQIRTVLNELLSNALDATSPNDGTITLTCRRAPQNDGVELIVRDTGVGMPPAVLQNAFDPFFSHRQAGRGRGLGLPRAYRIVELHGGRIRLESRRDEGTTARVLLPFAKMA